MSDLRLSYETEELLDSGSYEENLIAGGMRCHGGFDETGRYRSPRTLHRTRRPSRPGRLSLRSRTAMRWSRSARS